MTDSNEATFVKVFSGIDVSNEDLVNEVEREFEVRLVAYPSAVEGVVNYFMVDDQTTEETLMMINEMNEALDLMIQEREEQAHPTGDKTMGTGRLYVTAISKDNYDKLVEVVLKFDAESRITVESSGDDIFSVFLETEDEIPTKEERDLAGDISDHYYHLLHEGPIGIDEVDASKPINLVKREASKVWQDVKSAVRQMRSSFRMLWHTNRRLLITATVVEGLGWLVIYGLLDWLVF